MFAVYYILSLLFTPLWGVLALWRLIKHKEDITCISQRFGLGLSHISSIDNLIWVHCASVGETISILPLLDMLHSKSPQQHFLLTTYTRTAAKIVKDKNKDYIHHSYIPYDNPIFIFLFLRRAKPRAVFWVESEFWPVALHFVKNTHIPALLLNFRMSEKSYKSWQVKAPNFAKNMLSMFDYAQAQTALYGDYFTKLSGKKINRIGNLKNAAPALSYDITQKQILEQSWQERQIVLWASTHDGEEVLAFSLYHQLKQQFPSLLFLIVPRHPERGRAIQKLAEERSLTSVLRSHDNDTQSEKANLDIYIADTLGELGLFYALSPIAIIGNSFISTPGGGHNMLEAAHHGCAIVYGPSYYNFQEMHDAMNAQNCVICIDNAEALAQNITTLLEDNGTTCHSYQNAALCFAHHQGDILTAVTKDITAMIFWQCANKAPNESTTS